MGHEEELTGEFKRDCATERNRRRLAQEYASVDGEEFGRTPGGGLTGPRAWGSVIIETTNSTVTTRNPKVLDP